MPLVFVLAILGVIYLVRLVLGFVFASIGLVLVVALLVGAFFWFIRPRT